jgi:hypothetical protein
MIYFNLTKHRLPIHIPLQPTPPFYITAISPVTLSLLFDHLSSVHGGTMSLRMQQDVEILEELPDQSYQTVTQLLPTIPFPLVS